MSPGNERGPAELRGAADFDTTYWSVVLTAGHRSSPDFRNASSALCQTYRYPLFAYARRRGRTVEKAQDLTQQFHEVKLAATHRVVLFDGPIHVLPRAIDSERLRGLITPNGDDVQALSNH